MPVFIPVRPDVAPWNVVLDSLQASSEAGKKAFAQIQRERNPRAGFAIGGWDHEDTLRWWFSYYGSWEMFDDDRVAQAPWLHKRLHDALNRIEWLQQPERREERSARVDHVGLIYWIHPDAQDRPLTQYVRLAEGVQFPGSPRQ